LAILFRQSKQTQHQHQRARRIFFQSSTSFSKLFRNDPPAHQRQRKLNHPLLLFLNKIDSLPSQHIQHWQYNMEPRSEMLISDMTPKILTYSKSARELQGKYTQPSTPRRDTWFPKNLMQIIKSIISTASIEMKAPEFKFDLSMKLAKYNWKILEKYKLNLEEALEAQSGTILEYSSEFRPANILEPLFQHHPLWQRLSLQLREGADFLLHPLSNEKRLIDAKDALDFGNHKGADENKDLFKEMMEGDVTFGYSLVVPREKILELEGVVLSPMNIADQHGIDEKGNIIKKKRLTHNQSMTYTSGTSVNNRTEPEKLQDVMYGPCLLRVIHQIVKYRRRWPTKRIYIQKVDFKSAYHQTHLQARTALQTVTQFVKFNLCFISLRLTFGGAPNPNFWGEVSESITDLTNALLQCSDWNPDKLKSPLQDQVPIDKSKSELDERPLNQALPMAVQVNLLDDG
jgi:hypothetical protein